MRKHADTDSQAEARRQAMVQQQIAARGVHSPQVLAAMARVPRELFVAQEQRERAYNDGPLQIAAGQTISQPYVVAMMIEALDLQGGENVMEIGTGSGYAAAILAEIAGRVVTIERHQSLADEARAHLTELGYDNIEVILGDGTLGCFAKAPFDAIVVAAGGPIVPPALKQQLAIGGRLVIPVGPTEREQELLRIVRDSADSYREEVLSQVRFVPLIGADGWGDESAPKPITQDANLRVRPSKTTAELIRAAAEPLTDWQHGPLDNILARIADARVVLIGEASHGTSEFYRFRARLTQALIEQKNFNFVAAEADWPDASRIDHYVRQREARPAEWTAFSRFPTWMWRNQEVRTFVDWLHHYNDGHSGPEAQAGFYGLDLYSLHTSISAVLGYLQQVDPASVNVARARYGCLMRWQQDPASYGLAAISGRYRECEADVVEMLSDLLQRRMEYGDGESFLDATQNAHLIASAERYYRGMYLDYSLSWNLRDQHMFETLEALLQHFGQQSKAVVWAHNSHLGDASATDMRQRGQINLGQLCRERFGDDVYAIGFGTHTGTVAAASEWGAPMEVKQVQPSLPGSWESESHRADMPMFTLPLRHNRAGELGQHLQKERLQRAIGVIYRPETERASHYFKARLGAQFDEYIWFDETHAVTPLNTTTMGTMPDTYPFGL